MTGDFNAAAGTNHAYIGLTNDGFFADTWVTARERKGARGSVSVDSAEIVTFSRGGQFPSDRLPVVARLRMGAAR